MLIVKIKTHVHVDIHLILLVPTKNKQYVYKIIKNLIFYKYGSDRIYLKINNIYI